MFFCENGLHHVKEEHPKCLVFSLLEIVVVSQLFSRHDSSRTCEERHSWFPTNGPFDHLTIGFAGVVHKSCDGTSSGIDDHFVVETHEVVALEKSA